MERDYLYDSDLVGAFTFDFDDLKMHGRSYFKTGSSKSQYYNYAYAEALEIIEYSCAAEPPVQCSVSHLSRRSEPQ